MLYKNSECVRQFSGNVPSLHKKSLGNVPSLHKKKFMEFMYFQSLK